MRELDLTVRLRATIDNRISDQEVTEDLVQILNSDAGRLLLQEQTPRRYGDQGHSWHADLVQVAAEPRA